MARRSAAAGLESLEDLARKVAILEQELAVQREALERLRLMGPEAKRAAETVAPARKSA
jgi:hypothetical protein